MGKDEVVSKKSYDELADAAEMLWVTLANVSQGDWTRQTEEWQEAADRWRDNYHRVKPQPVDLEKD